MWYSNISARVFVHYIFNTNEDEFSNSECGKAGIFSIPIVHAHEWATVDFLHFLLHVQMLGL